MSALSVAAVRAELPRVPVRYRDGSVALAPVAGRSLPFAWVTLRDGGAVEVAWSTVAHVLATPGAAVRL